MARPVTLIFTNSKDLTVDRLIERIGTENVFRFNQDLWRDYRIAVTAGDFSIASPAGREVRRADVAKFLWRKPISRFRLQPGTPATTEEAYLEEEVYDAVREMCNFMGRDGKIVLIEPESTERSGKMTQCEIALRYFNVPAWEFSYDPERKRPARERVVKSLTSGRLDDRNFYLWTTKVDESKLDPKTPWFTQDLVAATEDITVAFVCGRSWGFSLDRAPFVDRTVDWREEGKATIPHWKERALPPELEEAIRRYMDELRLHYGRLDFLFDGQTYWFLEVNSNGEWGWLDPKGDRGLYAAIAQEVRPDTPLRPIPTIERFLARRT